MPTRVAARAGELGANVIAPPFDVFDAGRMAAFADPQGAIAVDLAAAGEHRRAVWSTRSAR